MASLPFKQLLAGLFLAILVGSGIFFLLIHRSISQPVSTQSPTAMPQTPSPLSEASADVVASSFRNPGEFTVDPDSRVLLVPHHLVAGREIAGLLKAAPARSRVLLLSPDHFGLGKQALSTTRQPFEWNGTPVPGSDALLDQLLTELPNALRIQDDVFAREHGIRGLVPLIRTAWPQAEVTPVTVRLDTSTQTIDTLARTLKTALNADPELTIIVTIDFSHDLPAYLADLHDAYAIKSLEQLDVNASERVEIDSPPLFRLLVTLTQLQQKSLTLHAHTNSLRLMNASVTTLGTSHVLMSQGSDKVIPSPLPAFTFFHDPTRKIVSSEDRAYRGYDAVNIATIPFPTAFVKEETSVGITWHAIPLEQDATSTWKLVSDKAFTALESQGREWETWAKNNLLDHQDIE